VTASWALISLTELIASLADPDGDIDLVAGVERMAETLDAEVAAVCTPDDVVFSKGFGRRGAPDRVLGSLARSANRTVIFERLGEMHVVRTKIDGTDDVLILARTVDEFSADEVAFVRAVGRVIGLSSRMQDSLNADRSARRDLQRRVDDNRQLLGQLRERQGLLDRLFRIQRSISHRAPTQDVLDAVTNGALDLLGVGRVSLRLRDNEKPDELVTVSSRGYEPAEIERIRVTRLDDGIVGRCIRNEQLEVTGPAGGRTDSDLPSATMAAPVHVNGEVIGCLTVSSMVPTRTFSPPEQEALLAFAEHASLALQDARAIEAMQNALARERHRAEHDPLTGLPNRISIQRYLETRIAGADEVPITVLFVDLDRFKLTNDTLGHAFGDRVLMVVADRLKTSVRNHDLVGRLSGDEFVVVCEGISEIGAIELAERIQEVISRPMQNRHTDHVITASVGIAGALMSDSAEQLVANADLAMYRAKQNGRARIEVFDLEFRQSLEERLVVGRDLRRALNDGELIVHFQPIVKLPARRVIGFEALVRWAHPTRGVVMPDDFIPLAEETGIVAELDRRVLNECLRILGASSVRRPVAVNLSARTFGDPSLVSWIEERLAFHGVDAKDLVVEVTETVLMETTGAAARQLKAIRALGVSVMIDDFGTGYSSLAYLQTFDVDGVKIDRGFTALLGDDARASAIVAAVLHMAEALDLVVVVEGVETDEQVAHVVELRDRSASVELHAQGFLFGRPDEGAARLAGFLEVSSLSDQVAL
jgi:diguanylate cyclase (GGDEF)-like protein